MFEDFIVPFVALLLAELGDKTQIAVFTLSTRTSKRFSLLLGVVLAFAVADGVAILFGDYITSVVPDYVIKIVAGLIFIGFGVFALMNHADDDDESNGSMKNPLLMGFSVILLAELGDKTQIASAIFATRYEPVLVFLGVMSAMFLISLLAVFLGGYLKDRVDKKKLNYASAVLFILIGIATLLA